MKHLYTADVRISSRAAIVIVVALVVVGVVVVVVATAAATAASSDAKLRGTKSPFSAHIYQFVLLLYAALCLLNVDVDVATVVAASSQQQQDCRCNRISRIPSNVSTVC